MFDGLSPLPLAVAPIVSRGQDGYSLDMTLGVTQTDETEGIPRTYADAVKILARWQCEGGPADVRAFSFPDPAGQLVRLVEVSEEFMPTGGIRPLTLRASRLFPFKSSVALASPDEWAAVEEGRLGLPGGWDHTTKEQVWP